MSYGCKCNCKDFAEHVGTGPYISGAALPTRGVGRGTTVREKIETEKRWAREGDAYKRLVAQGYDPPSLDGVDKLEQRATTETEIKHGKIYGDAAPLMEKAVKEELVA